MVAINVADSDEEVGILSRMTKTTEMDGIDRFHAHLDVCEQCREHPFDLCRVGGRLLHEGVVFSIEEKVEHKVDWSGGEPVFKKVP